MKLDKSYKVKVNPEQSREIHTLILKNGGEVGYDTPADYSEEYLVIEIEYGVLVIYYSDYEVWIALRKHKEITAPDLIALLFQDKETKMSKLAKFENCKQVRCIESNPSHGLKKGEIYDVISTNYTKLGFGEFLNIRISKDGEKNSYPSGFFEPVLEATIQATDSLDNTPMDTRTVNGFEVGDRIYLGLNPAIHTICEVNSVGLLLKGGEVLQKFETACHATPENHEMLCKLYPHIEFEQPPKELTGSDLCRAMLDKGWKYVPCYVSRYSDKDAYENRTDVLGNSFDLISNLESGMFASVWGDMNEFAVPFDPKTGEILTSEVLDEQ